MIKAVQYHCPICRAWIGYGSEGTFQAKLLRERASDASWAWKTTLNHLLAKHYSEIDELFPREDESRCPICGRQISGKGKMHLALLAHHLFAKHFPEVSAKFKEKYGVALVPEEWEQQVAEVDEAPFLARQAERRKLRKPRKPKEQPPEAPQSIPDRDYSPKQEEEVQPENIPQAPSVPDLESVVSIAPHPAFEAPPVVTPTAPEKEGEKMSESIPEKAPEEQKAAPSEVAQQPKEEIPEGFEKKSIFDFLKERVEPFHIDRKQSKEEKPKEKKAKARKGGFSNLLLPLTLVGGVLFLLWQSRKNLVPSLGTENAPAPAATTAEVPQTPANNIGQPDAAPVESRTGAYFDEQGHFHSRKYPGKKIM